MQPAVISRSQLTFQAASAAKPKDRLTMLRDVSLGRLHKNEKPGVELVKAMSEHKRKILEESTLSSDIERFQQAMFGDSATDGDVEGDPKAA